MTDVCKVCGNAIRLRGTTIKDGSICVTCRGKLPLNVYSGKDEYTGEEIRELFDGLGIAEESKPRGLFGKRTDGTEELRRFKAMLDEGLITQDDYDRKKDEILNRR